MISPALRSIRDSLNVVEERTPFVTFEVPLRLDSVSNGSQGTSIVGRIWRVREIKNKRGIVRAAATAAVQKQTRMHATRLPQGKHLVVLITRIAPRELDRTDNLPRSAKACIDGIADALGLKSDRDARVEFLVDQEKRLPKEYAVRIEIFER